jgi:predicted O-methyltransferase YrrM
MVGLLVGLVLGAVASWSAGAGWLTVLATAAFAGFVGGVLGQVARWARDTAGSARRMEIRIEQSMDVTQLEGKKTRDEVIRRSQALDQSVSHSRNSLDRASAEIRTLKDGVAQVRRDVLRGLDDQAALMESYQQLQRLVPLPAPMPRAGTWAASEDLLLWLVGVILERKPTLVVDLGSGQSSVWMAAAMREAGVRGRVIAIDHDAHFAAQTTELGRIQGVQQWLEVRHAPLMDVTIGERTSPWYDPQVFADLNGIGMVSVDGPPGQGVVQARWPALPILRDRLSPGALVILDDMIRRDEQDIADDWAQRYPDLVREELPFEKGSAVFTVA